MSLKCLWMRCWCLQFILFFAQVAILVTAACILHWSMKFSIESFVKHLLYSYFVSYFILIYFLPFFHHTLLKQLTELKRFLKSSNASSLIVPGQHPCRLIVRQLCYHGDSIYSFKLYNIDISKIYKKKCFRRLLHVHGNWQCVL